MLLALVPNTSHSSVICSNLFSEEEVFTASGIYLDISNAINSTFRIINTNEALIVPKSLVTRLNNIEPKIAALSNKELIDTINYGLQLDHSKKGYLSGLSTELAHIKSLAQLTSELSTRYNVHEYLKRMPRDTHQYILEIFGHDTTSIVTASLWRNVIGNIFSNDIYYALIAKKPSFLKRRIFYDENEIVNHVAIYLLHKEAIDRLSNSQSKFLQELGIKIHDNQIFQIQLKELKLLYEKF